MGKGTIMIKPEYIGKSVFVKSLSRNIFITEHTSEVALRRLDMEYLLEDSETPEVTSSDTPTKAELLGAMMSDNKVNADELIAWVGACDNADHINTVMEGEKRKTVKEAAAKRLEQLGG